MDETDYSEDWADNYGSGSEQSQGRFGFGRGAARNQATRGRNFCQSYRRSDFGSWRTSFELSDNYFNRVSSPTLARNENHIVIRRAPLDNPTLLVQDSVQTSQLQKDGCSYCCQRVSATLVKCTVKGCQRWFCNGSSDIGRSVGQKESHIITHLRVSQHRQIAVNHPIQNITVVADPFGSALENRLLHLRCLHCNQTDGNCFDMGMETAQDGRNPNKHYCRQCAINDRIFNTRGKWIPFVDCHHPVLTCINENIVKVPSRESQQHCKRTSRQDIVDLEREWLLAFNGISLLRQISVSGVKLDSFSSAEEYKIHFEKLVKLECLLAGAETNAIPILENVIVSRHDTQRPIRWIEFETQSHIHKTVMEKGQSVTVHITRNNYPVKYTATVRYNNERNGVAKIALSLKHMLVPEELQECVGIEVTFQDTMFNRRLGALESFERKDSFRDETIRSLILGSPINRPTKDLPQAMKRLQIASNVLMVVPGRALNQCQERAVHMALTSPLSLIQGPPGTGKTHTIVAIIYNILQNDKKARVLCCAPSNDPIDHLACQLARKELNLNVTRITSQRIKTEDLQTDVAVLTLRYKLEMLLGKDYDLNDEYSRAEIDEATNEIISESDVICTTCNTAKSTAIAGEKFKHVIIDEATQATEADSLIPITNGCEKLVLIGDQKQLGVVNKFRELAKTNLGTSLFERLIGLGQVPTVMLDTQYRMHPIICKPASKVIYDDLLKTGVGVAALRHAMTMNFIFPNSLQPSPIVMINTGKFHEVASDGVSILNGHEAVVVTLCLVNLLKRKVSPEEIGVITFYNGQKGHLKRNIDSHACIPDLCKKKLMIDSVDAFQGREKDFIILSCVRSGRLNTTSIGFLKDARRLNVALTRAKKGVIIVGNRNLLEKSAVWRDVLEFYPTVHEERALFLLGTTNSRDLSCTFCKNPEKEADSELKILKESVSLAYGDAKASTSIRVITGQQNFPTSISKTISAGVSRQTAYERSSQPCLIPTRAFEEKSPTAGVAGKYPSNSSSHSTNVPSLASEEKKDPLHNSMVVTRSSDTAEKTSSYLSGHDKRCCLLSQNSEENLLFLRIHNLCCLQSHDCMCMCREADFYLKLSTRNYSFVQV